MRAGGPFAKQMHFSAAGVTLMWPRYSPEERYCGSFIPWSLVRDADPSDYQPELRLRNGRTVFVSVWGCAELTAALHDAGVRIRVRPEVWSPLLRPFADPGYDEATRERCESRLHGWGFTDEEIRDIRRRVRIRMWWRNRGHSDGWDIGYGHADLLFVSWRFPAGRYLAFRAWAEAIAARADTPG